MAELLVIPSELERAAGRLQASADQVRSVVGGLLPAVALGGGALGDAALFDGFHTMWSRWAAELGVLADDLTGAATRLQAAAAEYRSTDQGAVPPPARGARQEAPEPGPGTPDRARVPPAAGARPSYAPLLCWAPDPGG
jgi:uncharacterized protein YukE